jgi:hypothetical protein
VARFHDKLDVPDMMPLADIVPPWVSAGDGSPAQVKSRFLRFLDLDSRVVVSSIIKGRHQPMPTRDGFDPAHPLPVFLDDQDDQYERQGIGTARDRSGTWSRVFKATALIVAATAIGVAALSGNPVALFAEVTASLVDNLGLQSATVPPTPTIQAAADAQAVPAAAQDRPTRDEIAAAEPAGQDQTERSEPPPEALFRQFQAWATEKDARTDVAPVQPLQDGPPQVTQNAPPQAAENTQAPAAENPRPSLRIMQEPRYVQPVHNVRAEMRAQNLQKRVQRPQNARAPIPPAQRARAQDARTQDARAEAARAPDPSVPNAQAPSFLPIFGARN